MAEILTFDPVEDCVRDVLSILEKENFEEVVLVGMHGWIRCIARGIWLQGYRFEKVLTNNDSRWGQEHEDIDGCKFTVVPFEEAKEIGDRAVYLIANTHGDELTEQLMALGCSSKRIFVLPDGKTYQKNAKRRMMESYGSKMEVMSHKEVQAANLNLLCKFKEICDENGLSYFLDAGTLLGAVRHQGFIPWDYDVDVAMPFEDIKRLTEVSCSSGRYEFISYENHTKLGVSAFADNNFSLYSPGYGMVLPLFIDIFHILGCGNSIQEVIQSKKIMEEGFNEHYIHSHTSAFDKVNRFPKINRKKFEPAFDVADSRFLMVASSYAIQRYAFEAEWYQDYTEVTFEGQTFRAPYKYREVLSATYGAYSTLPGVESRGYGGGLLFFKKRAKSIDEIVVSGGPHSSSP